MGNRVKNKDGLLHTGSPSSAPHEVIFICPTATVHIGEFYKAGSALLVKSEYFPRYLPEYFISPRPAPLRSIPFVPPAR